MTTFHGVQYVLAPDTHQFRRFVWMLIISLGFVIVTLQLLVEYEYFNSNPTSINVHKIYTNYIEFPAVTICNDNIFR
ncbi:unnamed protein product [Lymnaea stagnalis]|uniref:Uncharacterized protein n=1 Tax=Lymnaea stagnalis TaxID=6523 RepID=A0AAV2HLB8_LYMST